MSSGNARHPSLEADQRVVRASVVVNCSQESAFSTFVGRVADWWPLQSYSLGQGQIKEVVVERHVGGRMYEVRADGEHDWGVITSWNPPDGFMLRWDVIPGAATYVELTFEKVADRSTRVSVEHTGWENVDPSLLPPDCDYGEGWRVTLHSFAEECAKSAQ
ncbi:SRPBCC domain-containing protein [Streptomyces sp. WMMC500]|uniref:SRPBCC domain-containing protein n=1 Tax=Streptomyces sp. WMMC500 TaxID=3015154 RepID=UPI00248CBB57|nr:SRPBCC domain-containing protein [Streptomyces sp. WMMC500]WBB63043.1 SRPBCC domain-containing protein [Streptomyces sp. WMMC500]